MSFDVIVCEQRSDEWRAARAGRLTGSVCADMLAEVKSGESAKRRDLRYRLVAERLSGVPQEGGYVSPEMQWGIDKEADALAAYEALTGNIAMPVGFVAMRDVLMGCSPDGVVGEFDGLVSLKCPKTATHVRYLRESSIPSDYMPQILCELYVTGAKWCDFMSYDPRLPEHLQTFLMRYERDEKAIAEFARKAALFLEECATEESALRGWSVLKEAV